MKSRKRPRPEKRSPHVWGDVVIEPEQTASVSLAVTESYSQLTVPIPVVVQRGKEDGPTVFVSAALHGDEINGTGSIRALITENQLCLLKGTLILVPVINILGFDRHSRYLPDRRDLNRCFPGQSDGSLAARMAKIVYDEIVGRSDYGIDLHTAAVRRTNFPCIRGDLSHPEVKRIAEAFGCEIILDNVGPDGSFRREATLAGCPTIVLEAGEVWKVEPAVVEYSINGIVSVLTELGMVDGQRAQPPFEIVIKKSKWVRASRGGFLRFHVSPGDLVRTGSPLATNTSITGVENNFIIAPHDAIVLGMTTLPCIAPGDPICHLGYIDEKHKELEKLVKKLPADALHGRTSEQLSTNVSVVDPLPHQSLDVPFEH